jgi:hypothetical protein
MAGQENRKFGDDGADMAHYVPPCWGFMSRETDSIEELINKHGFGVWVERKKPEVTDEAKAVEQVKEMGQWAFVGEFQKELVQAGINRNMWENIIYFKSKLLKAGLGQLDAAQIVFSYEDEEQGLNITWEPEEAYLEVNWGSATAGGEFQFMFSNEGVLGYWDLETNAEGDKYSPVVEMLGKMMEECSNLSFLEFSFFSEEDVEEMEDDGEEDEGVGVVEGGIGLMMEASMEVEGDDVNEDTVENSTGPGDGQSGSIDRSNLEFIERRVNMDGRKGGGDGEESGVTQKDLKLSLVAAAWYIGTNPSVRDQFIYGSWKEVGTFQDELRQWGISGGDWKNIIEMRDTLALNTYEVKGGVLAEMVMETESGEARWQWDNDKRKLLLTWDGDNGECLMEFVFEDVKTLTNFDLFMGEGMNWNTRLKTLAQGLDICREAWRTGVEAPVSVVTGDMIDGEIPEEWVLEETNPIETKDGQVSPFEFVDNPQPELGWVDPEVVNRLNIYGGVDDLVVINGRIINLNFN